ncbi:LAFA_0B08306g1_1 [Lachancea sp. 'fantastica']|nr:LAFA_0B08306g1_1 [Lachancea sp. 'fantastica']
MSVLVTGATGFIALHIVEDLLKENYKVIGTVRSTEKGDNLKAQFGNNPSLSTVVVKDIAAANAFDEVFEQHKDEIKIVLHTASPFHFKTTEYEKDLLIPAIHGTKSILESIKKYGAQTVERVVVTSSIAAVKDTARFAEADFVYTEDAWNPVTWEGSTVNAPDAYRGSKKFAEKAAWDFLEENKDVVKFKLATVCPSLIFGPQTFSNSVTGQLNTSSEVINSFLHAGPEADLSSLKNDFVDVRDVSKAHLIAFQSDAAIGQRLGLSSGQFNSKDLSDVLIKKFPELKGKLPKTTAEGAYKTEPYARFDNSKTKKILGFEFINLEQSVYDTAKQILDAEKSV